MGIVLLIGMVAAGSIGILVVAGEGISSAEQQSEQEQVEQAFVELSQSISSATANDDVTHASNMDAGEHGAIAHHDSATYEIWAEDYDGENRTDIANGTIGTVEYESDDGTRVAYEGGGVFRETGERTQILSIPPVHYSHQTNTLSFPVVELTENKTIDSGGITVDQVSANSSSMNYIRDDHIFIEIESEYCRGWERHFTDQAGDTALQKSCYGDENDDGKLKTRLGYEDISNAFSAGAALPSESHIGDQTGGGNEHPLDDLDETRYPPLDTSIGLLVDDFKNNESALDSDDTNTAGKYYEESLDDSESYEFDVTDDDAIVVVNGSVSSDGGITVTDCDADNHSLRIYATGDFELHDTVEPTCDEGSVETVQFYGTSTSSVEFHDSSSTFEGLLYVASGEFDPDDGEHQVEFDGSGSVTFNGSLIANSVYFGSNTNDVEPEGLKDADIDVIPEGYEPAPQLTYLNIAEYEVDVENS